MSAHKPGLRLLLSLLALLGLSACKDASDSKVQERICDPGEARDCVCTGEQGRQLCSADGMSWVSVPALARGRAKGKERVKAKGKERERVKAKERAKRKSNPEKGTRCTGRTGTLTRSNVLISTVPTLKTLLQAPTA